MTSVDNSNLNNKHLWVYNLLLVIVLLLAAYFRFAGSDWGNLMYQHPDELFLTSVTYDIQPVHSLAEYFNTATSTLNPQNTGHGFFVYGTLPVFLVRGLAELTHQMGSLQLFGRHMSALADLLTVALLYFMVKRLYGPRVAILAAAFSAFAVTQIQESHFYTTDNFATFFMLLTAFFAVEIFIGKESPGSQAPENGSGTARLKTYLAKLVRERLFWLSVGFGLAFGMAMASKLSAFPLAVLLPGALAVRYFGKDRETQSPEGNSPESPGRTFDGFLSRMFVFMLVGGIVSILAFRILQPYAFSGFGLNPKWLANIREQRANASPSAGLLWNLQWARRTHLYSFQNLTEWGLGLPLGILAWAGFLWMAWRMVKGDWQKHIVLWSWTGIYFVWQSLQYNPMFRYQLPIYPLLAMIAAWAVFDWAGPRHLNRKRINWMRILAGTVGGIVLVLTFCWAYAFSRIYLRPETRVAASHWIYQNVPGPIDLEIKSTNGATTQQPLPFQAGSIIQPGTPYQMSFAAQANGELDQILIPHVTSHILRVTFLQNPDDPQQIGSGYILVTPGLNGAPDSISQKLIFNQFPTFYAQQSYLIQVESLDPVYQVDLCGPLSLTVTSSNSPVDQVIQPSGQCVAGGGRTYTVNFTPTSDGALSEMTFSRVVDMNPVGTQSLQVTLASGPDFAQDQILATASGSADFTPKNDPRGESVTLKLDHSATLHHGEIYYLRFETNGLGLTFSGAAISNETDIDWNLPFRLDGYDGFNGIYRGDLNLQVYWEDNANKLARFQNFLNQTDYIFIPTSHQYMQITRLPERYPLTTEYYRQLLGCPVDKDILWCYRVAEPGMFQGKLGFDLVANFESYPTIGPVVINDQNTEESFTFYDHPKVMIFKKNANYNPALIQAALGNVDLSNVVQLTPGQADHYKSLLLPASQLASQQAGGTWSELFNREAVFNQYPGLGAVLWYLVIFLLGLFTYPLVRAVFPGLNDHGYPLARIVGLLIWAWLAWIAGSAGLTYNRATIAAALIVIVLLGVWQGWRQRRELMEDLQKNWKYFLMVEGVFLSFFLLDLLIRLGNSDLWHPSKGGERPMDFAYFNAILKSTSFPPYDPWFAGGYINYYYYGYVIVGTPVKLLGIVPSIAYNFILPTLFACVASAAFSVGWNILHGVRFTRATRAGLADKEEVGLSTDRSSPFDARFIAGISASSAMVLLGNLGVVRMLYQGFQQVAAPGGMIDNANIIQRIIWTVEGFLMVSIGKLHLPYGLGNWYWDPSRALPASSGDPITEFPLFTFIFSDLHAHMIALMLTILSIAWALSVLLARAKWRNRLDTAAGLLLGGLIIGSLKPTNTWDFYTYLILGAAVLIYAVWRYADISKLKFSSPFWIKKALLSSGAAGLLVIAALLFYQPFNHWFLLDPTYTKVSFWSGGRSDISSYLVHWGLFLFIIISWMTWETRQWLAHTPVSSLKKLRPYRDLIIVGITIFILVLIIQQAWVMSSSQNVPWKGVTILWLALPLAVWAAILLFRPGLPDGKRLVLFMIGTGLLLTMLVEIIVMGGDIGRMNTVFKIYYQAWVLLGLSAAAGFGFLLDQFRKWTHGWQVAWQAGAAALIAGSALFLVMGGLAKIQDRMSATTPHTLDSMTFMNYSTYNEFGVDMNLSEDYRAIRWMQDNVKGSPVIAEAAPAGIQYAWLGRFSIYTGLPDVIGWEWHQIQQRLLFSNTVRLRGIEEDDFYSTTDISSTLNFLKKYNVRYIIVGELERAKYGSDGLNKFSSYNGIFWDSVYADGQTVIYQVPAGIPAP